MPVLASRYHASKTYKRMAGRYVYYTRLERDHPDLYASAVNSYNAQLGLLQSAISPTSEAITNLKQMANLELAKEEDFLRKMFGTKLNINLMDQNMVKDLIDTLNGALQFKEIYERNRALILETRGQKNITTWFGEYFNRAWNENIEDFSSQLQQNISNKTNQEISFIVENQVDSYIEICTKRAIEIMTTEAKRENGLENSEYDNAYREFYSGLLQFESNMKSLASNLREVFELDKVKEYVMEQMKPNKRFGNLEDMQKKLAKKQNVHSKGGESLEVWENAIVMQTLTEALGKRGIQVESYHTGQFGVKADNIYTAKLNININDILNETSSNSREQNIKAFSKLGNQLAQMDDGYIIYSNAKNYTLNSNFHGFSAGADMDLNKLGSILNLAGQVNVKTLIGIAEQTGAGAIGEDSNSDTISGGKESIERYIALNIAAFLFDDFTSIGDVNMSGANALHIFDLNGVFVPLSVLLFKLAEAAEQAKSDITGIVRVDLEVPPILYPDEGTGIGWKYWVEQKADTLANTKVSIHFLKNLRDILS